MGVGRAVCSHSHLLPGPARAPRPLLLTGLQDNSVHTAPSPGNAPQVTHQVLLREKARLPPLGVPA